MNETLLTLPHKWIPDPLVTQFRVILTSILCLKSGNEHFKMARTWMAPSASVRLSELAMTPSRAYSIGDKIGVRRTGKLALVSNMVRYDCRDLVRLLEKEQPSFEATCKALEDANLKPEQRELALAWILFHLARQDSKLHGHLPLVATCIRDLTAPDIDVRAMLAVAAGKINAGDGNHYIQTFLLPKLKHILERRRQSLGDDLVESFKRLEASWYDNKQVRQLLDCFVFALRAEGDIPSAIAASATIMNLDAGDYETQLDLLALHVTGIAVAQNLRSPPPKSTTPFYEPATSEGSVMRFDSKSFLELASKRPESPIYQEFFDELLQAFPPFNHRTAQDNPSPTPSETTSTTAGASFPKFATPPEKLQLFFWEALVARKRYPNADYVLDQYILHALILLKRYGDVITLYNRLVEKDPTNKDRFLPWFLNASHFKEGWDSTEEAELWPCVPVSGSPIPPTAILEAGEMARYYSLKGKDYTKGCVFSAICDLARHANNDISATATDSTTKSIQLPYTGGVKAMEAALAIALDSGCIHHLSADLEDLNTKAHSKLITSALARYYAQTACVQGKETDAEKAISLYRSLWPNHDKSDLRHYARACEVIGDHAKALQAYILVGGDEIGSRSRIDRSICLAKLGRHDEAIKLYNTICTEKESYTPTDWIEFDSEWGLFFTGNPFTFGSPVDYVVPPHLIELEKGSSHLRRAIDSKITSMSHQKVFDALEELYTKLGKTEDSSTINLRSAQSSHYGTDRYSFDRFCEDEATSHLKPRDEL